MKHKPIITSLTILILLFLSIGISAAQEPTEDLSVGAEVVERRTARSKHFYLGNGQYQARIGSAPIHYRDAQGNWQEIDTTLRPQAKGVYAVEANGLQTYMPSYSGGLVSVAGRVYPQAKSPAVALSETETPEEEAGPLRPVDVSLSWQPVAWRYTDAAGHLDDLAAVQPVAGQVEGDTITYEGVMPGVNESYRVIPNGLKHQLTLLSPSRAPADGLSGELTLDYVGTLELPASLVLYADGAVQAGDFTTDGPIEVRDSEGHPLLVLTAPVAYEAQNRQKMVGGSYAVWWEGENLRLAWRTPAAWLLAPERHYPVVIDPTVEITLPSGDTFISPGLGALGSFSQLWVGYDGFNAYRALLSWIDLHAIPSYALLDDDSDDDGQVRLYLTDHWGDGNSQFVRMYRITTPWLSSEATWTYAADSTLWNTPGGDYDDLVAVGWINTSTGYKTFGGVGVRDTVALWRTFLTIDPIYTYGHFPAGFLLKLPPPESGNDIKIFASQENTTLDTEPLLIVNYTDGPRELSNQSPVRRRVPSPDYYATPAYSLWWAVGTRMSGSNLNYYLELHRTPTYGSRQEQSRPGLGSVNFIVVSQDAPEDPRYPLVYSAGSNTGNYQIEYAQRTRYFGTGIDPDDSYGPYTMNTNSVIRIWSIYEPGESENCISIVPTSGDAQLGVAIFESGDYYYNRDEALVKAVAATGGSNVSVSYVAPSTGVYGLVVWNEGSSSSTDFNIEGCTSSAGVFLPIVVKNN
jgi:hypothetical protein